MLIKQKLKDSELRYRRLFETAQDGILILNAETGMIKDVNPFLINLLGYTREEFVEKKLWEVGAFRDVEASKEAFETLRDNEYIRYENLPLKAKNGRLIQVEFVSNVYFAGVEKVIQCNIRDITEHKRIIIALKESEKRYHDFVNQSPDGIFIMELSGRILTVNKAMCRVLEYSETEFLLMNIWDIIPEEYLDQYKQRLTKILEGESFEETAEYAVRGKSGRIHYVEVLSAPHYSGKHIIGFQGIARDITQRKKVEASLRESEERFRIVLNSAPITIFATDSHGIFTLHEGAGRQRTEMKGNWGIGELGNWGIGDSAFDLYGSLSIIEPDGTWSIGKNIISRVLGGETVVGITEMAGEWFENKFAPLLDAEKKVVGIVGVAMDITARKRDEQALAESQRHYRQIIETAGEGIWTIDNANRTTLVNQHLADVLGYTIEEIMGKSIFTFMDEEGKVIAAKSLGNQQQGINQQLDFKFKHKNGNAIWMLMETSALLDSNRQSIGVLAMLTDITRRKKAEEDIHQRLSELEVLYQSGLAFSQLLNPKSIAQKVIDLLSQKMDWHHTAIRLYHPESETLELMAFNLPDSLSPQEHDAMEERFNLVKNSDQGLSGWVIRHAKTVLSNNLKNNRHYLENFPGLHSGLYVPIKIARRVLGVISIESAKRQAFSESDKQFVTTLAMQAAVAIDNAQLIERLKQSNRDLASAYDATIEGWSRALDLRDKETEGHSLRVTKMTLKLARALGLSKLELVQVRWGALLHDIGKMGIPDGILLKPGKLTDEEWVAMKKHPTFAYQMLLPIHYLQQALDIPYCHHEKWDGSGYPRGLKGDQIPLVARIFAVVDVWDALRSDRPYRAGWTDEKVREHISISSGTHFDPKVVNAFMEMPK